MSDREKAKNVKSLSEFFQLLDTIPVEDRQAFADAIDENQLPVQERELFSEWLNAPKRKSGFIKVLLFSYVRNFRLLDSRAGFAFC